MKSNTKVLIALIFIFIVCSLTYLFGVKNIIPLWLAYACILPSILVAFEIMGI